MSLRPLLRAINYSRPLGYHRCLNARAELESSCRHVYEVPTDVQALSDFKQKLLAGKPRTNAIQMFAKGVSEGRQVYEVPTDVQALSDFKQKLLAGKPRTNAIQMCTKSVSEGLLKARFYTNGWPLFTTAICQILSPKLSDVADLVCHSTSKEDLLHLLRDANLITWGKWQLIFGPELAHADYLMENLRPPSGKTGLDCHFQGQYFYYPGDLESLGKESGVEGYFTAELKPEHLDMLLARHTFIPSAWPVENHRAYFDFVIRKCRTVAVFQTKDPTTPVGWEVQFPHGLIGYGYIVEGHRRKGLAEVMGKELMRKVLAKGYTPEWFTFANNPAKDSLSLKMGGVEFYTVKKMVVKP